MTQQNTIVLEKSGVIIIQDAESGQVNLDVHNLASTSEQLRGLSEAQIASLLQILDKRPEWPYSFGLELKRVVKEKNIVKGGISNINGKFNHNQQWQPRSQ